MYVVEILLRKANTMLQNPLDGTTKPSGRTRAKQIKEKNIILWLLPTYTRAIDIQMRKIIGKFECSQPISQRVPEQKHLDMQGVQQKKFIKKWKQKVVAFFLQHFLFPFTCVLTNYYNSNLCLLLIARAAAVTHARLGSGHNASSQAGAVATARNASNCARSTPRRRGVCIDLCYRLSYFLLNCILHLISCKIFTAINIGEYIYCKLLCCPGA